MTPEERTQLVADVAAAIKQSEPTLTDDEQRWVRLAIKKEAQSISLRQAIIEKTLAGLIWSAIVALGVVLLDYAKNLGWRP